MDLEQHAGELRLITLIPCRSVSNVRLRACSYKSPVGSLQVVVADDRVAGIYFPDHCPTPDPSQWLAADEIPSGICAQLDEYFAGERQQFDLPVHLQGTDFQTQVWRELQTIPYGSSTTYGELAKRIQRPNASRAVGAAVGRNPISIVIPCHRVVGASGKLTGFAGGLGRKKYLLDLEGSHKGV